MTKDRRFDFNNQKGALHPIIFLAVFLMILVLTFVFVVRKLAVSTLVQEAPVKKQEVVLVDGIFTAISVGGVTISAEVAKSNEKKSEGLSNRASLEEGKGMIFVFDRPGIYPFWNKDTFIPLDVLWIENNKVVYIGELPAFVGGETAVVAPDKKADFVLEVNAGFVKAHNIKIGDSFSIK